MDTDIVKINSLPLAEIEAAISRLVCDMSDLPQLDHEIVHEFADGVYARKMIVPEGAFVIGKTHRFSTYNILLRGSCTVYYGEGVTKTITAPFTFTSKSGIRKMAMFHEESEWINIHPTEETDLEKIEDYFIIPETNEAELTAVGGGTKCLGQQL